MKISEVTVSSVSKITDKELRNLHWRVHLIYNNFKKHNDYEAMKILKIKHTIIVKEMLKRGMKHNSPL